MRDYTERELILNNLLAMAATLVYRSARAMAKPENQSEQAGLIIECEAWFFETKYTLSQIVTSEAIVKATDISAQPVESYGVNWKSPQLPRGIILSHPGPAKSTETVLTAAEVSSIASCGENIQRKLASKVSSKIYQDPWFSTKF